MDPWGEERWQDVAYSCCRVLGIVFGSGVHRILRCRAQGYMGWEREDLSCRGVEASSCRGVEASGFGVFGRILFPSDSPLFFGRLKLPKRLLYRKPKP